jgi:Phage integrase family
VRRRVLKPAAVRVGLLAPEAAWRKPGEPESWVAFHTFRHTSASLLFEGGKNVRQVAAWLGHSDPSFTLKTYVHLVDEGVGAADFLDAAVRVYREGSEDRELLAAALAENVVERFTRGRVPLRFFLPGVEP